MVDIILTDLAARLETDAVRALLLAFGYPAVSAAAQADRITAEYHHHPQQPILGAEHDDELLGLIGLRLETQHTGIIRHIVVHPAWRRHGVSWATICAIRERFGLHTLIAETDWDAVDFYRRCGFAVESLGEIYPGTERFRCVLSR